MQIIAFYALIFALGAAGGGTFGYKWQEYRVLQMQNAIAEQKIAANTIYNDLVQANTATQMQVIETNNQRDISYVQNINTINALHEQLSSARLRKPASWKSCSSSATASNSAESIANTSADNQFPARLHEFFAPRTFIADQLAQYAKECYNFVIERNCGISVSNSVSTITNK